MRSLGSIGADGLFTLFLSNIVMVATVGVSLGMSLLYVMRTARIAPRIPPSGSVLVVLGMRLDKGKIKQDYALRLKRAVNIYSINNNRYILVVGGVTDTSKISEATRGREYLISYGVNPEHISIEDESQHTLENLRNARTLLHSKGFDQFTIISNRYHLARSYVIAEGLGLKPGLCAAEEDFVITLTMIPRLLLEAYYIHWYRTGSTWSRLIRNKKSLERIR